MTTARLARLLIVLLTAGCSHASPLQPGMDAVEKIRGREFVREVRNVTIARAELAAHLRRQIERTTPYSLEDWGTLLRALQLVDGGEDPLLPKLLSLYEAQVLAFYDPQSHTYFAIREMPKLPDSVTKMADPKMLEETVMVHELTHALQDQHFDLGTREKALMRDADANLAYHAVLEGEAVLVMTAHMLEKAGVTLDEAMKENALLDLMASAARSEQMIDPSTPPYFAEMLKFPYLEGLRFVVAAYQRGGWKELDRVHASPPRTTREILHPDEYFAGTLKPRPFDPKAPAGAISAEHLGEFHWRFLLGAENARGWVDDRAVVYRDGRVEVTTTWETPGRAEAFASAYGAFLEKRGVQAAVAQDGSVARVSYRYQ